MNKLLHHVAVLLRHRAHLPLHTAQGHRPVHHGAEMRPGCCSCTAEWRSWWLIWGLWYVHSGSGVCNLLIYLVMNGHRKLVVHSYRNLMVATMMYCTATGTWISYRTLNCDIQELCHPECPKPTIVQNKTNQIRQRIISKACRLAENLFQSIFILYSDPLHCRKFI